MKEAERGKREGIALVSTPWPLYSRPSIQLGVLKAHLRSEFPDLNIVALHLYLKVAEGIGYKHYRAISERTWLAESIYGALLFPERREKIERVFYREAKGKPALRNLGFDALVSRTREVSESLLRSEEWTRFSLVGFSICLCQLTSTLYFIKRIKEGVPLLPVVVGGSMFPGETGRQLLETFPEVDFVVGGEGELPLSQLVRYMGMLREGKTLPPIAGLAGRNGGQAGTTGTFSQLKDLNSLPPPDYDDYFELLNTLDPANRFFPTLPAEMSRGCWWRSRKGPPGRSGCAFCNLNLQWDGYRHKGVSRVVSEVDYLTTRYKTLSVAFMDNLVPLRQSKKIFSELGSLRKDFRLFAEIRAITTYDDLKAMRRAGMHEIQVGIEALSTRLLKKLRKGTTAIQNLQIMMYCEELGISNISNLILQFPGSDDADVDETLHALEFAMPFRPLRCVHFWLGLGSPVWQDARAFGLKSLFNHPNYSVLFPQRISRSVSFMIQSYKGDRGYQRRLWQPVKKKVRAWKEAYGELHCRPSDSPILSFGDGRDFLVIRQRRLRAEPLTHRLVGPSRAIYLFCQRHRPLKRIMDHFPHLGEERITPFLKMMVEKRLMFEENGKYLSLAIPARGNIV